MNERKAWSCGYADAMRGFFFCASAPAKSQIRLNWMDEYIDGWKVGREHKLQSKTG